MKASEVKTYEEIVDYIAENVCDETAESVYGIDVYKKYCYDKEQEATIEKWVLELWDNIKGHIISDEEHYENYTFEQVPLLGKFVYNTFAMVKILDDSTGTELGIDYMGRRTLIESGEVVERV